ncbi:MAG: ATP-binding cassette domain-containing protein [Flavonifractor plautii]
MLKAEHITKQYQIPGGRHTVFDAVSDVSIELGDGGVAAIVGESGSGKSTLARVLSYVERPDGGGCFWMVWRCPPAEERTPRCKR